MSVDTTDTKQRFTLRLSTDTYNALKKLVDIYNSDASEISLYGIEKIGSHNSHLTLSELIEAACFVYLQIHNNLSLPAGLQDKMGISILNKLIDAIEVFRSEFRAETKVIRIMMESLLNVAKGDNNYLAEQDESIGDI